SIQALPVTGGQKFECARSAARRSDQPFALRIFANGLEQPEKRLLHARHPSGTAELNLADSTFSCLQLSFGFGISVAHGLIYLDWPPPQGAAVSSPPRAIWKSPVLDQSSQLNGYFSSSSATAASVNSSVCCVSNITASSSVRVAFLLAMIVPGCGPTGMPRGCSVIDAGSIPRRDPKLPRTKNKPSSASTLSCTHGIFTASGCVSKKRGANVQTT